MQPPSLAAATTEKGEDMEQTTIEIINMLSLPVLLRIKKQCEAYITYTIDFKQVNNVNYIKNRQKVFAEILEQVNSALVFKQAEFEKVKEEDPKKSETVQVQSTMNEAPIAPSVKNNSNAKKTKKGEKG